MPTTTHRKPGRKAKKSYTLSPESVDFLEVQRKKRRATSISAVLDEILQAVRREAEMARINQSITEYYDSLTDEEVQELDEWGRFGLSQLLKEDA
jgi:methylthioribose-1-phosphate isomerase